MNKKIDNQTLTLFFKGEIDSSNASKVEEEIEKDLASATFKKLVLDFRDITYVSSAGLRIILKIKKKYQDVKITNVSLEVYDVFQMTGFTNIMDVYKALRKVDIEGAELIGEGYFSLVYRINKDTIIKVFKNNHDIDSISKELNLAKQAFILGIPTAISFDIVEVGDRYGVVFEMLDSVCLRDLFLKYPDRFDELVDKYAKLVKTINSTEPMDDNLPDAKVAWINKVKEIKDHFEPKDFEKCLKLIESIPEKQTFVHGDCHFKNIMTQGDDLLLIDMETLSKGHHIFELASLYSAYLTFEEDDPGNNERFFGVKKELSQKIFYTLLEKYMGYKNEELVDKIRIVSYLHVMWWNCINEPENLKRLGGCQDRLLKLIPKYDDLKID